MIGAALLAGVPPSGLGAYAWQGSIPPGSWDFLAVSERSPSVIAEARAAGLPVWIFAGPDAWRPETWRATLARQLALVDAVGAVGLIANPEAGWTGGEEASAFGAALAAASRRTRVGVVTIPSWGGLARAVPAAGSGVWWSCELYAHTAHPSSFRGHLDRWRALGVPSSRHVPSVAGFVAPSDLARTFMESRESYRAYLDALPGTAGAIVWPNGSTLRSRPFMGEELRRRFGLLRTAPSRIGAVLASRAAALVGAVLALGVLFALTVL